jgi:hypothetical protein
MNALQNFLDFCETLRQHRTAFQLLVDRTEAVMITVAVPGERWEIEFFADGSVEVERFVSQGVDIGVMSWSISCAFMSRRLRQAATALRPRPWF